MSKVLGFTKNGGEDWFVSSQYGNKEIQNIPDPEGGHAINAPTSIPSPFARMDLIRKSFENIVESPNLEFLQKGNKVVASKEDEKLVSQCLDLAEILFFFDNYKNQIKIVEWNKTTQINNLKTSRDEGHKRFGEALELYLLQDAETFNFDLMQSIYLIKYNHQVIGGTSPLTLFFSASNDHSNLNLKSNKGTTYFKDVIPLYLRDESFQKYLYLLFNSNTEIGAKMKAFQEYLNKSLKILSSINKTLFLELNTLNSSELDTNYVELNTNNAGQVVEVLNVGLKTIDPLLVTRKVQESEFVIHAPKGKNKFQPLVLQNNFNKALKYVNANWDAKTLIPFFDEKTLSARKLPGQDITYPYLTISDFLEPQIIRLVYPINSDRYFDGNFKLDNVEETKSYLLPLKLLFFEFFEAADLINGGIGKPQILIDETSVASAIRVHLKIPINKGKDYIVFERVYHNDGSADESNNKGIIKEHQFGVTIFPFIKHNVNDKAFYNIQLVDRDVIGKYADTDYRLSFFSNKSIKSLPISFEKYRNQKIKGDLSKVGTKYYNLEENFDYIQVDNQFSKGIIIPNWRTSVNNGNQFTFAIDFGTTNTHIEYSLNNTTPKPFEILAEETQSSPLFSEILDHNFSGTGAIDIRTSITKEFIPEVISKNTLYNFPHRTVISQSTSNAPTQGGRALIDFNIPVIFEKSIDNNNKFFTNLKWDSKEPNNDFRVKAFLEQLIMLIRNKVIINDGDLSLTKIIWTYPTSMSIARRSYLQSTWNALFYKYISIEGEPIDICESIAPYYYFQGNAQLQGLGFGVSVLMDIGGGTSDVVVYSNNVPKLISSYKFAGNTLFGDGYTEFGNISNNHLINKFKEYFNSVLNENNTTLKSISDKIYSEQKSSDYNTFLFSLSHNSEVKDKDLLDYNKKIADDSDLKIIFLYFYCAKVYHIAQLMKTYELAMPMNFIFSGNGSKILNIISPNQSLISEITKQIFLKVYGKPEYPSEGLKINVEKEFPKEVTCKGALINHKQGIQNLDISNLKKIYTSLEKKGKFNLLNSELTAEVKDATVIDVQNFNNLFIGLNRIIDFNEKFDVSPGSFQIFKRIVNNHLNDYLSAGIEYNNRMDGPTPQPDANIAETLFFYPIVETIQQLINELAGGKQI